MATWPWPNTSQEAREINTEQFEMLLERGQTRITCRSLTPTRKMNARLSEKDQKIREQQAEIKILNEKLAVKKPESLLQKQSHSRNFMNHSNSFLTLRKWALN